MESGKPEISDVENYPRDKIEKFLRDRSVSESLIANLLEVGVTDEFVRLLKAMGFSDEDTHALEELWVLEAKNREKIDSSVSPSPSSSSSSDESFSPDGIYLKNHLSRPLSRALRDIVVRKPSDPIEYLGYCLLNYKVCEERGKRRKELELKLAIDRRRLESKEKGAVEKEKSVTSVHEDEDEEEEEFENDWDFIDRDRAGGASEPV